MAIQSTSRPTTEPIILSHTGADPRPITDKLTWDDKEDATEFFTEARNTGRPIIVDGTYKVTDPGSKPDPEAPGKGGLHLIGRGGRIVGEATWGFHVRGGSIKLSGDLTFEGFRDESRVGPGTDWQGTGARGACIGIQEFEGVPARVEQLIITPGVRFLRSRTGITCSGADRLTLTEGTSNQIAQVHIDGLYTDDVACPIIFTGTAAVSGLVTNCTILNCIGGFQEVGAIRIGPDDIPVSADKSALAEFKKYGGFRVIGNYIDTVIQKVTSGDSSPGNQYSSIGIICNGWGVVIMGNIVNNVTGCNRDCEGIYTKSVGGIITANTLYNSGSNEAAIAIKGYNPILADNEGLRGYGLGAKTKCFGNNISFDEYIYAHTGHDKVSGPAVIEMERNGITINSGDNCECDGNTVTGSNGSSVIIDADNSLFPEKVDTSITNTTIRGHRGHIGIRLTEGRFTRTKVAYNDIQFAEDEDARRYARQDDKWYPVNYLAGIESTGTTVALHDTVYKGNTTTLLGKTQTKDAYCVSIRLREGRELQQLIIDDNEINGEGNYEASTVHFAADKIAEAATPAFFVARNIRNTYRTDTGQSYLFDADAGSIPNDFEFSGVAALRDVETRNDASSRILRIPLSAAQVMNITIDWTATRLDVVRPFRAKGFYELVLTHTNGIGGFIAAFPTPRPDTTTTTGFSDPTDLTDPYNLIAYGDPNASPPVAPSPNFSALGREALDLESEFERDRLLQALQAWTTSHTHSSGGLRYSGTTADGGTDPHSHGYSGSVTGRSGTPSALTLPQGVSWPTPDPAATTADLFRVPVPGEVVWTTGRLTDTPPHGIAAETYPQLADARLADTGYPKIYTVTEEHVNTKNKEFYVAVIRFDPVISGKWRFSGEVRVG